MRTPCARRQLRIGTGPILGLALGLAAAAAIAAAGGLDPFQSPFHLRVSEPREGATVPEGAVRVVAELLAARPQSDASKDTTPPPKPRIDIFLDNEAKGSPKEGQSSLTIGDVAAGTHTLLVTASDPAGGAVVERQEVHFTALPPPPQ